MALSCQSGELAHTPFWQTHAPGRTCAHTRTDECARRVGVYTHILTPEGILVGCCEDCKCAVCGCVGVFVYLCSVFPCATPAEVRASLPPRSDVVVFQCRNPVHR